ncbi:hypothetical protein QFZ20_002179 [Flavobacterium sp. W4I14]|nr:hypothetical protein [Flavobacterium sp. W4I14]
MSIQNIHYLNPLLSIEQITALEKAAERHSQQANMDFKIHSVDGNVIQVETGQGETASGKYATRQVLVKRTEELFEKRLPGFEIHVTANAVLPAPTDVVNVSWIDKKMQQKGLRIKQIAFETGIDRESISD